MRSRPWLNQIKSYNRSKNQTFEFGRRACVLLDGACAHWPSATCSSLHQQMTIALDTIAFSTINQSNLMEFPENHLVMPGDHVTDLITGIMGEEKYVVGPGLQRIEKDCIAIKCGILHYRKRPDVFWVDSNQRRVGHLFLNQTEIILFL